MKIGFICNEFPPGKCGGIGIFTRELSENLVNNNNQVIVVGTYQGLTEDQCTTECNGSLTVYKLASKKGAFAAYKNRIHLFRLVKKLSDQGEIELIEVPDFEGGAAGWPKLKIPVLVRLHGTLTYFADEMGEQTSFMTRLLERLSLQRADSIVSVSQYTADKTKALFRLTKDIEVIYNSVAIPEDSRCKINYQSTLKVAYSGSLVKKKGVFSLAKAWPLVKKHYPEAKLIMIGKDVLHHGESAQQLIKKLAGEAADSISFTGHVSKLEMENILVNSDLAIYPSYSESFGLAPIESMALGVPTIYSTKSCGPEIINEKGGAILCNPSDIKDINQKIIQLLENENLREQLGKRGRVRTTEDFSVIDIVKKNLALYSRLITQDKK